MTNSKKPNPRRQNGLFRGALKLTFIGTVSLAGLLGSTYADEGKSQADSLTPYTQASEVPQTALELWKDYDPRKEALEVKIHQEWKQDGVVSRLISFKVGTFKGSDSPH